MGRESGNGGRARVLAVEVKVVVVVVVVEVAVASSYVGGSMVLARRAFSDIVMLYRGRSLYEKKKTEVNLVR